jgi:hypothetical protein
VKGSWFIFVQAGWLAEKLAETARWKYWLQPAPVSEGRRVYTRVVVFINKAFFINDFTFLQQTRRGRPGTPML